MKERIPSNVRPLNELNLIDDFLFYQVVSDPEYGEPFCRMLLEIILQRKLGRIVVIPQKENRSHHPGRHSTRLDVCIAESSTDGRKTPPETIIDVEPETAVYSNSEENDGRYTVKTLLRRTRYYHSSMDMRHFPSGNTYGRLFTSYVIMIMSHDPFGKDRILYTVQNRVLEDPSIPYDDGAVTIFLYTRGTEGDAPDNLRNLLRFMEKTTDLNAVSGVLREMQEMVDRIKEREEVSDAYMKAWEKEMYIREDGRAEGLKEGLETGRMEAITSVTRSLMNEDPQLTKEAAEQRARKLLELA